MEKKSAVWEGGDMLAITTVALIVGIIIGEVIK